MPKVTEAHLEARRSQILDAAWTCFARTGYHQTTMQDICEESGLSPGAVYRYFESKKAILKAINERSRELGRAVVEQARSQAGGPLDVLRIIGRTMLSVFYDPEFETIARVNIEVWPEIVRDKALREGIRHEMAFWQEVVAGLFREAKSQGLLRPDVDPDFLAILHICAWEGLRHYRLVDPEKFSPERMIELVRWLMPEAVSDEVEKLEQELHAEHAPPGIPFRAPADGGRGRRKRKAGSARSPKPTAGSA